MFSRWHALVRRLALTRTRADFLALSLPRSTRYAAPMISALAGTVRSIEPDAVILDVHEVGFQVAVLPSLKATVGSTLSLFTHLHVRENELTLYGFAAREELAFFRMLLEVPGVGPKSAMSVLALAPVEVLVRSIASGDAGLLTKVSGVGRKTAERIVVELKSRLAHAHPSLVGQGAVPHADVVEALVALGYTIGQAREAVRNLPKDVTGAEEGIRAALQALGQRVPR